MMICEHYTLLKNCFYPDPLSLPASAVDNGLGLTPPMGWRSWNCFGGNINQTMMTQIMDEMTATDRVIDGEKASLKSIGYNNCGLDDAWQKCGAGVDNSFHDKDGNPIIDTVKFPDMGAMVEHGHALGVRVGWYMNNCICQERLWDPNAPIVTKIMEQSVAALVKFKFDGLKLDSCSQFNNLTWWNQLLNATGRPILVENCHQGGLAPGEGQWQTYVKDANSSSSTTSMFQIVEAPKYNHKLGYLAAGDDLDGSPAFNITAAACMAKCSAEKDCLALSFESPTAMPKKELTKCYLKKAIHFIDYDASNSKCTGTTMPSDCPFNFFRTSGDINPSWESMMGNLATVPRYLGSATTPAYSRPGAFAYPDMLEVGRMASFEEDRSHFGAWCIISAPLILGLDLRDAEEVDRVWPIITNKEAIAINQNWAGSPGHLLSSTADGKQIFIKVQTSGAVAVLFLNGAPLNATASTFTVAMKDLGLSGHADARVRDVWKRVDEPKVSGATFTTDAVAPHDSRFFLFGGNK